MPRQIDHQARRRHIADAVCLLADERGLEGVTLRDVATRAEVSMGAVQRCFRTKEEMLTFALDHVGQRVMSRVRAHGDASADEGDASLAHAATETALLREERRAEARVWLAFFAQSAVSPSLATILQANYAELEAMFVRLIREANASADATREARTLLALTDGLTLQTLVGHLTPDTAQALLAHHLDRLAASPH